MSDCFETPWTIACQDPLSMEFSRQEYWSGLPFLSPGDLPDPEMEQAFPALEADFSHSATWEVHMKVWVKKKMKKKESMSESHSVISDSLQPMDYIVHGILQARILEWVAFSFSRGSFQPRDWTQVSHIAGRFFTRWATREAHIKVERCLHPKRL